MLISNATWMSQNIEWYFAWRNVDVSCERVTWTIELYDIDHRSRKNFKRIHTPETPKYIAWDCSYNIDLNSSRQDEKKKWSSPSSAITCIGSYLLLSKRCSFVQLVLERFNMWDSHDTYWRSTLHMLLSWTAVLHSSCQNVTICFLKVLITALAPLIRSYQCNRSHMWRRDRISVP
jgi:hypothetical protein